MQKQVFAISPRFYPIRLSAYSRSQVELSIEIENKGESSCWVECSVTVPEALSLAPDKELAMGRIRIGIINPGESLTGKCKIYTGAKTYPDVFPVKLVAYGFGKDGAILQREEKKAELRCVQLGITSY